MTLSEYIKKHGPKACSERWGVSRRTVNYWAAGTHRPRRLTQLPRILQDTGLSVGEIYR